MRSLASMVAHLLFAMAVMIVPVASLAQTATEPVTLPNPLTPEAVDSLVSRLTDEQVRSLLLERLDAVADAPKAAEAEPAGPADLASALGDIALDTLAAWRYNVVNTPEIVAAEGRVLGNYLATLGWSGAAVFFGVFLLAVLLGIIAETLLYRFYLTSRIPPLTESDRRDIFEALPILAKRLWRETAGTLLFFVVVSLVVHFLMPVRDEPVAHAILRWIIFFPRLSLAVLRFFLAPKRSDLRLMYCDNKSAKYLFFNFLGIVMVIGLALALLGVNQALGATPDVDRIAFWLNVAVFVWLAIIFVRARDGLRSIIRGRTTTLTSFELWAAHVYPWFGLAAIGLTWIFASVMGAMGQSELLRDGRHLVSLAVLLIAPMLDTLIRAIVQHMVPPMRGDGAVAMRAYDANLRAYTRIGRVVVFGAVILITARLWDMSMMNMASAGVGEQFAVHLVQALMICVSGYLVWEIVRLLINRKLANEYTAVSDQAGDEDKPLSQTVKSSRLGTVLPPISWALQAVIIILTVLTALGNLGIDVTPLLAGAGIAGIAIGFGAQKLVSDVVSGLFFLIDDAFRLNEFIDAGGTIGTVEKISLRSLQLRDAKGPVLIIPYSNIKTVTNFGRDWGIMKLRFTVPFDTDVEKVRKIFKRIGLELMENPELAPGFIEPFKSQGVAEFNDVGIVVRGKFMHKPGAQFAIRKQIFKRVQEEFAANGIQFARREVRVSVSGSDEKLTEEQLHEVGAAAAHAVPDAPPGGKQAKT
ncbi:MAG: mechanosensitive ion channel protein MscS [Cereibacter sphaeroides]|uniref:Mechanosensitive ion channel protein MscS n=1 Tax=Cereibacter sphaeroides TaxID=1063 RepID=A0A2W5SMJ7_CERSP|nr:MAG: mechanosensitive ion channel protein MscS [Cereibacter sphaeroides]